MLKCNEKWKTWNSKTMALKEGDSGKKVAIKVGEAIAVELKGNPTTGYGWAVEAKPEGIDVAIDYTSDPHEPGMCGVGGVFKVTVKATAACAGDVVLGYKRPWETQPALQSFTITVEAA